MSVFTSEYIYNVMMYVKDDMMQVTHFLPYGMIPVIVLMLFFHSSKARGRSLLIGYLIVVFFITLLSRESGSREGIDWTLFQLLGRWDRGDAYTVENILLFVPIGFLLPMAYKIFRNILFCTMMGFLISVLIEWSQYITKRGFVQLEDIVTNVMGTLVGFCMFMVVYFIYRIVYFLFQKCYMLCNNMKK